MLSQERAVCVVVRFPPWFFFSPGSLLYATNVFVSVSLARWLHIVVCFGRIGRRWLVPIELDSAVSLVRAGCVCMCVLVVLCRCQCAVRPAAVAATARRLICVLDETWRRASTAASAACVCVCVMRLLVCVVCAWYCLLLARVYVGHTRDVVQSRCAPLKNALRKREIVSQQLA